MQRSIAVLIASLALVSVVRSDDTLRCYMCTSLTTPGCDTDPEANHIEPVECNLNRMVDWQHTVKQHSELSLIPSIFEVDNSQHYPVAAPMACAKMLLKVNKKDVIVRNCQTAKTETIDPCKALQGKVSSDKVNLQHCELCMEDACNGSIQASPAIILTFFAALVAIIVGRDRLLLCNA